MAFPNFLPPPGYAAASSFEPVTGPFTGMPRDIPGPQERGPAIILGLPAGSPAILPLEVPAAPSPMKATPEAASSPVVPAETALSLQQWSAALVGPSPSPVGSAPSSQTASGHEGQRVSLAALAEHLSARLVHGEPDSSGELDLWQAEPSAAAAVRPDGLVEGTDWNAALRMPLEGYGPEAPGTATLPTAPPSPTSAVGSPAGIRAAAGLPANPPKSLPELRQGDVFFLDHPPAAHPSAVMLESGDFLLASSSEAPLTSPAPPPAPAVPGLAEKAGRLSGERGMQVQAPASETPSPTRPPPLPTLMTGLPPPPSNPDGSGTGLVLGGAGLVLLGIYLACRLPLIGLEYRAADGWPRQLAGSSLLVHAGGSLVAFFAGVGSLYLQRWAVTLVLAAGWLSVFTAALLIGIAAFLLSSETPFHLQPGATAALLGGLLIPLIYLLYYEKQLPGLTLGAHPLPAEPVVPVVKAVPDVRSVPLVMLAVAGGALSLTGAAMLFHPPALPWPDGQVITGPPAQAAWTALLLAGMLTAFCAWHRRPVAWWLLLLATAGLCATVSVASLSGTPPWETFLAALGRPDSAGIRDPFWSMAAGLAPLIPGLVLLMTRRSLPTPPPP